MNNRYQGQATRRGSEVSRTGQRQFQSPNPMSRSTFFGYSSFLDMFSGIFRNPDPESTQQPVMTSRQIRDSQIKSNQVPTGQRKRVLTVNDLKIKRVSDKVSFQSPRQKVVPPLLPNTQQITQRLFNILQERVQRLQRGEIQPIFMETTIITAKDDIKHLFTNTFLHSRLEIVKHLTTILKCFAVHRLDIGQRKGVAMFAALLFGIFNQDVFLTFVQLSHMALSPCFLNFLIQNEPAVLRVEREIEHMLQDKCPGVFVLLANKYKISTRFYLNQWIGSLFLCLQLEGVGTQLDRYYDHNEDEFILGVLRHLFTHRFSKNCLVQMTLSLMKSLQKQIFRQDNRETVIGILKKPRSFINEALFFRELSGCQ